MTTALQTPLSARGFPFSPFFPATTPASSSSSSPSFPTTSSASSTGNSFSTTAGVNKQAPPAAAANQNPRASAGSPSPPPLLLAPLQSGPPTTGSSPATVSPPVQPSQQPASLAAAPSFTGAAGGSGGESLPNKPASLSRQPVVKVNIVPRRSPFLSSDFYQAKGHPPQDHPSPPSSFQHQRIVYGATHRPPSPPQRSEQRGAQHVERNEAPLGVSVGLGPRQLAELEHLLMRESQLLEQLKKLHDKKGSHHLCPQLPSSGCGEEQLINELPLLTSEQQLRKVAQELKSILESKRAVLSMFALPDCNNDSNVWEHHWGKPFGVMEMGSVTERIMAITSQPSEIAVANRYLMPGPVISVVTNRVPKSEAGTLIVSVKLLYHTSGKEVTTTLHGKQEILQGIKQVTVDKLGRAIFNKVKVMEVSSKHRHQSFCLEFCLEEYSAQGVKRVITSVKSTPFHVQSRPAKRKREAGEEDESSNGKESEADDAGFPNIVACTQKKSGLSKEKKLKRSISSDDLVGCDEDESKDLASAEGNFIDITVLLTLPQKEAAKKLGISESMLCKRFKECTRRKWPYRYLRKIDKIITMLNLHKADGQGMSEEDRDKLTRLHKEREECLRPVKIRITSCDRLPPIVRQFKKSECDEEDIPIHALETLEMLRIFKPQGENESSESSIPDQESSSSSDDENDELDYELSQEDNSSNSDKIKENAGEQMTGALQIDADDQAEDGSESSMQLVFDNQRQVPVISEGEGAATGTAATNGGLLR